MNRPTLPPTACLNSPVVASVGYQIALKSGILSQLSSTDLKTLRKLIIDAVLATDFVKHFEHCNNFKAIASNFNKEDSSHRAVLVCVLLKFADISNPTRPWPLARAWAWRVQAEFFQQVRVNVAASFATGRS